MDGWNMFAWMRPWPQPLLLLACKARLLRPNDKDPMWCFSEPDQVEEVTFAHEEQRQTCRPQPKYQAHMRFKQHIFYNLKWASKWFIFHNILPVLMRKLTMNIASNGIVCSKPGVNPITIEIWWVHSWCLGH